MNTTTNQIKASDHIYFPEDARIEIPTGSWAAQVGMHCFALTSKGQACSHKATHIAKCFPLCSQHAASHYTIDVR